jgi:glycosyltransferase
MATGEPLAEFVEMFTRFGLQPRLNPRAWIDPCPPSLLLPTDLPRLALRYVPYNGPAVMADWLLDWPDRPRVCVTRGVTGPRIHGGAPDLFYRMVEALTGLDIEVVLAVGAGQAGQLGDIPAGVRVVEGVAFNLLLPSCAVVVHQGGGGTTMTALVCGTPQLILSPRPEQMVTGDQIAASRAGEHLVYNELPDDPDSVEAIRSAVADLVGDPARPAAALRLQHEALKMPAPAELVPALLDLAGRG